MGSCREKDGGKCKERTERDGKVELLTFNELRREYICHHSNFQASKNDNRLSELAEGSVALLVI